MIQTSAIYQAQYVPDTAAAKLVFTPLNSILSGADVVPPGATVVITSLFVTNLTGANVTLKLFRGIAGTIQYSLSTGLAGISVPPSSYNNPGLQILTAPIILMSGDSIWGLSSVVHGLNITGDGQVIS